MPVFPHATAAKLGLMVKMPGVFSESTNLRKLSNL